MLTQDEAELYDRQIRLWGVNAQSRIRQSKVLMLGFEGIASEVAKILVLAGIDSLTIVDNKNLQESDLSSNLFCRPSDNDDHAKKFRTHDVNSKLKKLNPLVKLNTKNVSILDLKPEDYDGFDLVTLHSFLTIDEINLINKTCRDKNIKFYIVLDYGFFGFMFNDLGKEFKFTYEVFENIEDDKDARHSGEEKDPISIGDDAEEDNDLTDDEDNRPKKKRRLHSPKRETETETKSVNEKTTKVGTLSYASFQDMISSKSHNCNSLTSPVLFTSITMLKFYSQYQHMPRYNDSKFKEEDVNKLNNILESIYEDLDVSQKFKTKLDPNWYDLIHGSLSPICAVLGGVAGQDMIRALSTKDIPISNTFLFDGTTMTGIVDKVGLSNLNQQVKPIVRDFIQFDSDDD